MRVYPAIWAFAGYVAILSYAVKRQAQRILFGAASGTRTRIEQLGRLTPNLSAIAAMAILLPGCASMQPDAVKVYINVPVPCVKKADLPKPPAIQTDAELAKLDDAKLILTIAAERLDLKQYASESGALLLACAE